ncbi:DEAD/DEAH box helicase family protein, partial [bacterium]|nr:DEAD/DEAH box helicase family protein [bacterium]
MKLRPYQPKYMIDPAIEAFKNGSNSVVIVGPTGSGKSSVLAWWAQQCQTRNRNVLTICHKQIIQGQLRETFRKFGVPTAEVSAGKKITGHKIQVARIQSLINRLDSIPTPDWILGDEGHHFSENNSWGKAVKYYKQKNPNLKTLLVTATPNGMIDGRGLHPFADTMISDLPLKYLVDEGWLVYPHMMRGEKIPKFHIGSNGDYDKKEQESHFKKKQIIGSAVDSYHEYMDGEPCIVSCVSLDHAHFMQEQYAKATREKGKSWNFVMIQGGKKYEKQMFDALSGLSSGSVQGITFVDVLGEGLDVPACVGLQMMRKMMS